MNEFNHRVKIRIVFKIRMTRILSYLSLRTLGQKRTKVEFSNHHTISNGYDGNKRNFSFGQELCSSYPSGNVIFIICSFNNQNSSKIGFLDLK
jgi:hypothetical protein